MTMKKLAILLLLAGCHKPRHMLGANGSTTYWTVVGGIDAIGNQYPLFVNDAGQIQVSNGVVNPDPAQIVGQAFYADGGPSVFAGGAQIGFDGGFLGNIGIGSCTLSSAACNAAVTGVQNTSTCTFSLYTPAAITTGMCTMEPDAGAVRATCPTATTGVVNFICIN
jgi:hypothetical protein